MAMRAQDCSRPPTDPVPLSTSRLPSVSAGAQAHSVPLVRTDAKEAGAYFTPPAIVETLIRWAVRSPGDRLLDPSCGDGRFLAQHGNSVGVEPHAATVQAALASAPGAVVHHEDFFSWAARTADRFDCAAGNPPFIRYQRFKGSVRSGALALCARLGATFSGLSSSWAPFLVATAGLLKPGGRLAFVVPAEIGHAPYSAPLIEYLVRRFDRVQIVAFREKLFPDLSEDCWLLYADGFGGSTSEIRFTALPRFRPMSTPPRQFVRVPVDEWRGIWQRRLRPFVLADAARALYRRASAASWARRLGDIAAVGIGYVTGDNAFFHLRPSDAERWRIPPEFLLPSVRTARALPADALDEDTVDRWRAADEPILLLRLPKTRDLPAAVHRYLESEAGRRARGAYKCRTRDPWFSVPDVQVPDLFLSYMSGVQPNLVANLARCTCTNAVHSVRLKNGMTAAGLLALWDQPLVRLSCEIEGHPLGGGMLKLEPGEAARVIVPDPHQAASLDAEVIEEAVRTMRAWRHYDD